ncbi:HxlR family transcriptional regulator [Reticulibacter mediterranei]|uniref:HxlR family transcriptional regulator n=1 Tax=Reticulibacter mediterranei TaxID=2778369 RepID=A0A8J3IWV7_9CHLR|nr:helix-turn-helix domain-containing protein [Reticulibacter mediterranei]GHO98310.1 HxlR family transcriptional regulator [Reticulibacter mediterranei]
MGTQRTGEDCMSSIRTVLHILGGKWSFLVLAQLYIRPRRFNQLLRALDDISTKALTDTLRHLERNEIIRREVTPTVPITVEYSLTEKGKAFRVVLSEMNHWMQMWGKQEEYIDKEYSCLN